MFLKFTYEDFIADRRFKNTINKKNLWIFINNLYFFYGIELVY